MDNLYGWITFLLYLYVHFRAQKFWTKFTSLHEQKQLKTHIFDFE